MVPWDLPWGTWGPYLGIPSIEYFPNVFSEPLEPLGLPIPSNVLGSSKKLKFFPSGCVLLLPVLSCREIWGGHDLRLRHVPLQHFSCTETIQIFIGSGTSANGHHGGFLRQIWVEWICTENYRNFKSDKKSPSCLLV